jgi:hypothetical protein
MIDNREGIKLVETGGYIAILNVRKTTQVNDEIGAALLACQFVACSLHVSVGQAKAFARPA